MPKIKPVSQRVSGSLSSLVLDRKSFHRQRILLTHGLRKLRFLRNEQKPPKQFMKLFGKESITVPLAHKHVQTVVGAIAKHRPVYKFVMRQVDDELRGEGERWATLFWQQMERRARKPLYWKWVDSIVADGMGVIKFTRHPWENFPERTENESEEEYLEKASGFLGQTPEVPLHARVVDPMTVFFPTYEWEPGDFMESGQRSITKTMRSLGITPEDGSMTNFRIVEMGEPYPEQEVPLIPDVTIEVSEIWTEDKVYFGFQENWFEYENPYNGIIPYVVTGGATTSSNDPALEFMSSLFPFQKLGPWTDAMVTSMVAWAMSVSNPILTTSRKPGPGITPNSETAIEEIPWGKHLDLGVGGEAGFASPPDIGNSMKEGIDLMTSLMDKSTLSPAASGFLGTRTAGLALSTAVEQALAMLIPTIDNMQMGMAESMKMVHRFINEVIKAPVYVSGFEALEGNGFKKEVGLLKWGPDDTSKVLDILVDIKKDTTQDEVSKGTHAAFMRDKGIWTEERAMLYSGVDDVAQERKGIMKDRARKHPVVEQYLAMQAVAEEPPLAAILQKALGEEEGGILEDTVQGPAEDGPTPFPGVGDSGPSLQNSPAPTRGGRPKGSASAIPRGPGRTNPSPADRR